jgi:hypothetical protein
MLHDLLTDATYLLPGIRHHRPSTPPPSQIAQWHIRLRLARSERTPSAGAKRQILSTSAIFFSTDA